MLSAYIEIFSMKTYMDFNEQNKLMNKIKPEAWIHGPDQRSQKGKGWEGLEEISQRTYSYMHICTTQECRGQCGEGRVECWMEGTKVEREQETSVIVPTIKKKEILQKMQNYGTEMFFY